MERNFRIIIIVALATLLALPAFAEKKSEPDDANKNRTAKINWMSLDKGILALEADSSGKHVFIDVTASWCYYCKKMDKETFSDPDVIKFLNDKFISVKLWGDSDNILDIQGYKISERSLAKGEFKVSGYPGYYFITPDKKKLPLSGGYLKKKAFLSMLTYVETKKYEVKPTPARDSVTAKTLDSNSTTEKN